MSDDHTAYYYSGRVWGKTAAMYFKVRVAVQNGEHVHVFGREVGQICWNGDCPTVDKRVREGKRL